MLIKRKLLIPLCLAIAMVSLFVGATTASASPIGVPTYTTLDACDYFFGFQTATRSYTSEEDGVTYTAEYGTWNSVFNHYPVPTPVLSVNPVVGTYYEVSSRDAATGNIRGVERFMSPRGNITQTFARTAGTWSVTVVATGQLSFLTSDTNGHCYTTPYPRP